MIALVVGLIIVLGAGKLFIFGLQSFRQMDEMSRRQETLRYVSDVMIDDVRSAFNKYSIASDTTNLPRQAFFVPAVTDGDVDIQTIGTGPDAIDVPDIVVNGKSNVLVLEYFVREDGVAVGRPGLPYCTGANQELHWLKYEFSKADGELSVFYECHEYDPTDPEDSGHDVNEVNSMTGGSVVASGLKDVRFSYSGDFSIQVEIDFPPLEEGGGDKAFSFVVTNRAKALTLINGNI